MKTIIKRMLLLVMTAAMLVSFAPTDFSYAAAYADESKKAEAYGMVSGEAEIPDSEISAEAAASEAGDQTAETASEADGTLAASSAADEAAADNSSTLTASADLSSYSTPEEILSHMTTRQKITQCLMMEFRKWEDEDGTAQDMTVLTDDVADFLSKYQFGSVILFAQNIKDTEDTLQLTKDMQAAAMSEGGLPLIIATDQEGGIVYRLGSGTALPGNMALGATGDTANAKISGEIIGRELSSLGINTTLSPVVDVNNNANNIVIGTRSFGDDAETVGKYGAAYVSGLDEYNTIGCLKHFPGHGDTATDSHTGLPVVNKSLYKLSKTELLPFQTAIDSGVDMIMTAHIVYPKVDSSTIVSELETEDTYGKEFTRPATMSKTFLTDILRGDMGFEGVVVTDAMNMAGISNYFTGEQATYEAIMAGADIVCMPVIDTNTADLTKKLESLITYIENKVKADTSGEAAARLDEAVIRVLKLKQKKGILIYNADDYTAEKALAAVGSDENRSLEREISAKAVTVVRDDSNILPYRTAKNTKVLMLCPYDNEKAQMVMGLNRAKAAGLMPKSVEVAVYRFSKADASDDSTLKEKLDWADLVIINSELSDAEDMSYGYYTSSVTKAATEYCRAGGKTSVVMSVNIPYDVQLYPDADAVIAVYGCKGSGMEVTDDLIAGKITSYDKACGPNIVAGIEVIFGVYGASGKLPVNVSEFDVESQSYTDNILYARGYGITYSKLKPTVAHAEISLSKTKFAYTGKTVKPKVTVKDTLGNKLKEGTDYTIKNSGRKSIGTGKVTIKGKGSYTGTVSVTYKVVPKKTAISSVKKGTRKLQVKMSTKPSALNASGYQAAYRLKGSNEWNYSSSASQTVNLKGLKKGKSYVIKARAYKKTGGAKYYGSWSKTKTATVK